MDTAKETMEALFCVNDVIACANGETFRISSIQDDRVQLSATKDGGGEFWVDYRELTASLPIPKNETSISDAASSDSMRECFRNEYEQRVAQAKRDAEVDAMWRSAIVCQIQ